MPKLLSKEKITDSHSTITDSAIIVVNEAGKYPEVSKISIANITHVGGGRKSLKFLPIIGGIKAVVRGSGSVQEIYIYTSTPEKTEEKLLKNFLKVC
jgi:hypothetical protein